MTKIQSLKKLAVFTDSENSPRTIAQYMLHYGERDWTAWACENLGGVDERVRSFSLEELAKTEDMSELNVLILLRNDPDWQPPSFIGFLNEDDFEKRMPKKGLITKREVRLLSVGFMYLKKASIVWDIGAGSGSVAIEAARIASDGVVYAVEVDPECVRLCRENLVTHKVDNVEVIEGLAPEALQDLPAPDCVFVGGSKGNMRVILDLCLKRLNPDGTLVVNAITMENVQEAYQYFKEKELDPEITLLNVSRGVPLARYHRYEALNPIHIFAIRKK